MRTLGFIVSIILIFLMWRVNHLYKCRIHGYDEYGFGFILGSVMVVLVDGCCWYWIFKFLNIL